MFRLPKDPNPSGSSDSSGSGSASDPSGSSDSSGSGSASDPSDSSSCKTNLFCKAFSLTSSKNAFCSCDATTSSGGDNPATLSNIFFEGRQVTQSGTCASK